jgi:hypothetical protein
MIELSEYEIFILKAEGENPKFVQIITDENRKQWQLRFL